MIYMSFLACVALVIIAIVIAAIMYVLNIRIGKGVYGFAAEVAVGWVGGWLGWIWGHWWFQWWDVYVLPAIVGSAATILIIATLYPPKEA